MSDVAKKVETLMEAMPYLEKYQGKVIVIDPGHGYGKVAGKLDPGSIGNVTEQSVNLAVAKVLEKKLTAMGATVVRLKTESEFILTETRPTVARSYGADMFISLHCNAALNQQAHGVEVYYFTSFSQPLAKYINDNLSNYYDSKVYGDGTNFRMFLSCLQAFLSYVLCEYY